MRFDIYGRYQLEVIRENKCWKIYRLRVGKKVKVSAADMEKTIASSTAPDQGMLLVLTQLHRSMWIRGDGVKRAGSALDATALYPDIKVQTVEQGLAQLL